ncbi:MAG: hypothetical protein M3619_18560 [Myxococcota bacterium]|nr:hypothetical protein [Myxococcota bacterium]
MRREEEIARDIVEHPERDDLRLEFAEAVFSRDPVWAQLIRAVVDRYNPKWDHLNREQGEVVEARLEVPFRRFGKVGLEFHRGFPSKAYMPLATFLAHGDEILSLAPILEVVLNLPYLDDLTCRRPHWNAHLPALVQCPALARVRELRLGTGWCDFDSVKHLIASPYIENLLRLTLGHWHFDSQAVRDQQEDELWPLLLESPVFRRMINWGILGATRRYVGDRSFKETIIEYDGPDRYKVHFEPMSEDSRALEQTYGYIPCFHAGNWKATVLDVLRGTKPDYPAGATPTEEMYAVPPPAVTF